MAFRPRPPKGIGRFRKFLRRMPDTVRAELLAELHSTGRRMLQAVRSRTPRKFGALREGISSKVLPTSLRLQIGLLGTPKGRAKLFYGRIQDLGRKAQVVTVQRRKRVRDGIGGGKTAMTLRTNKAGRKMTEDIVATYTMKVPAMPAKRFVTGRLPDLRGELRDNLKGLFTRSLNRIGGGDE